MFLGEKEITGIFIGSTDVGDIFLGEKESWASSKPWVVYEVVDGVLVANSPASIPYSTRTVTPNAGMYMWQTTSETSQFASISTNNEDGTRYLPTNKCTYLDIVVSSDWPQVNTAEVYALVDGVETLIHSKQIPEVNSNTENYIDGVQVNQYVHNWTNIDVEGYELVKVVHKGTGSSSRGVTLGIGVANFHN